jgi:hypothetical protein
MNGHVSPQPIVTTTSGLNHFVGPALRMFARDVHALLGHHRDRSRMDLVGRFRTTRVRDRTIARQPVKESERHCERPAL